MKNWLGIGKQSRILSKRIRKTSSFVDVYGHCEIKFIPIRFFKSNRSIGKTSMVDGEWEHRSYLQSTMTKFRCWSFFRIIDEKQNPGDELTCKLLWSDGFRAFRIITFLLFSRYISKHFWNLCFNNLQKHFSARSPKCSNIENISLK